jgi:hypothetical protein
VILKGWCVEETLAVRNYDSHGLLHDGWKRHDDLRTDDGDAWENEGEKSLV